MRNISLTLAIMASALMAALPTLAADPADNNKSDQAQQPAPVINIEALSALDKMGQSLRALKSFQIDSTSAIDLVLTDGQKLQINHQTLLQVVRPNKIHTRVSSSRGQRELFYDGKNFTIYNAQTRYYATVGAPATIHELIDNLQTDYGISLPLVDLFYWENSDNSKIQSALVAGTDLIDGKLCDHYLFRQDDVDWQVWIERNTNLPRKLIIINKTNSTLPQYTAQLNWKISPKLPAAGFTFKPSKADKPITIMKLDVVETEIVETQD